MCNRPLWLPVLAFCFVLVQQVDAQQADTTRHSSGTVRVTLQDGTSHIGVVEEESGEEIHLLTLNGVRITIPRNQVRSVNPYEGQMRGGQLLRPDPNYTRLLFGPTARPLGSGHGYVAAYELFLSFIGVGAGDAVNLAGGITLIPGLEGQFIYAAPKVTLLNKPRASVAAGVFAGTFLGDIEDEDIPIGGIFYGVATIGRPDAALTFGAGYGFTDEDTADRPVLMLGGEYQVSSVIKLLTENYMVPGEEDSILLSGGIRFFGDRLAADLAFFTMPTVFEGGFPFFPWLGFAYNFGVSR